MVAGPDVSRLGNDVTKIECAARLAAALTVAEVMSPYVSISQVNLSPADIAIHVVNDACAQGRLGFLHRALNFHEGQR